jgi:hypothetical protein
MAGPEPKQPSDRPENGGRTRNLGEGVRPEHMFLILQ